MIYVKHEGHLKHLINIIINSMDLKHFANTHIAMVWMSMSPQTHVLKPWNSIRRQTFEGGSRAECGALTDGISALWKGLQKDPQPHRVWTQQEGASYEPGRRPSAEGDYAGFLILIPCRQNCEQWISVVYHPPVCGMLL